MNGRGISKFKDVILWREFSAAWIIVALLGAALAVTYNILPIIYLETEGGIFLVAIIFVFTTIYRAARTDRDSTIERNELKSILASVDDALIVYETDFRAIFFNPAAENLFGIRAKSVVGHKFSPQDAEKEGWRVLVQAMFPSLAPRVLRRSAEDEYPQVLDLSFNDPQLEFRVTTVPIVDDAGKTLAFMKIIRNRTAQLIELKSRSEFVNIASHQLRGPVGDITWALETLEHSTSLSENDRQIVENSLAASRGLLQRIEDLLNIARMEEGQITYNFDEVDIVEFINKTLAEILPAARKVGIQIYFDRPNTPVPHVIADTKGLSLVLVNLLENAIRYNVENGEIIVKVDVIPGKPFVQISVKDSGIGIPPEAMEKIFNKFYRADNALKAQTEGSGLGLYIAKRIVIAHGGQIWVKSEVNRGTTVFFALPTSRNLVPRHVVESDMSFG